METRSRTGPALFLSLITGVIGWEWLHAGWEKVSDPAFAGGMPKTLATFAGKNPHQWYQSFLTGSVAPNSALFATLISWGELFAGVALIVGAAVMVFRLEGRIRTVAEAGVLAALIGGALMSVNFYFAAGWLSASTDGINTVMGWTQVMLGAAITAELVQQAQARNPRTARPAATPRAHHVAA